MKVDGVWWLEDRADRDQVYVIPLGLNSQKPVVVEICASPNSAIWQACRDRGLECISVTKEERNLLTRETQKELYRLLQRDVPLWIHISTPCTAGCRYRFLNRRRSRGNQYARQWKKVYAIHGEMWEFLGKFLTKAMKRTRVIVSQEWPEFNDLWKCPVYSANSECLRFRSRLDRCRFTRFREWKAYRIQATWRLEEVLCSHERSQHRKVDLYESGFYPIRMGEYLLKKALEELLREAPAGE